jgi:hypothetical protein
MTVDVVDGFGGEGRAADDFLDDAGQHVIRADFRERSGMAAEGRACAVIDISVEHDRFLPLDIRARC